MTKIHVKTTGRHEGENYGTSYDRSSCGTLYSSSLARVPQGPITFDEERYRLGESIFMKVRDLQTNDKGSIMVYTPLDMLFSSRQYTDARQRLQFFSYRA